LNLLEALRTAFDNLAAHKLRSGLSMLGMIFGVGAVIAMLSIGAGAENEALAMIDKMGLRNIIIRDREIDDRNQLDEIRKKSIGLSRRDMQAIREGLPRVELVAPKVEVDAYKIMAPGARSESKVYGVSYRQAELAHLELSEGRFLDALDEKRHGQVAVIGPGARRKLFGYHPAVGAQLKINDVWFEVVGLLAEGAGGQTFEGVSIGSSADEIYVPFTTAIRKFDRDPLKAALDEIVVRLEEGGSARTSSAVIANLLDRIHGGVDDFELIVPEALLAQRRRTQRLFNIVMGCIAGISLLVGGIGIMNIMLATVLERTREIGLRRAVGARRADIRVQFVIESFAISFVGGVTGVIMGIAIARIVAAYADWPTVVTLTSVLLSTGVSVTVGLASGIYPAIRAAELDPIDALRYE
jgi:putative ABC transport system permease protein